MINKKLIIFVVLVLIFSISLIWILPEEKEEIIGFVGCSITHNAVDGYHSLGGEKIWVVEGENYGGGSVTRWRDSLNEGIVDDTKDYWGLFEGFLQEHPDTEKIWWELCSGSESRLLEYNDILEILNGIKTKAPGIEIYVTPMPVFLNFREEPRLNNNGTQIMTGFIDKMIGEGKLKPGPILSPLKTIQTNPDGGHANAEGKEVWGQDLINFFG